MKVKQVGISTSGIFPKQAKSRRMRIVLFALLALGIVAMSCIFFFSSFGEPVMGIVLAKDTGGWKVTMVDATGSAGIAGIAPGDRPVQINGQPAQDFLQDYEAVGTVLGSLITKLTVSDAAGQLKTVDLQGASPNRETMVEQFSWFLVSAIFWIAGFYVFYKRQEKFSAFMLCLCSLLFGLALSANIAGERTISIAIPIAVVAMVIGPWLLAHFFIVLPDEHSKSRSSPWVYLIYLPAAVTLVLFPMVGYADGQLLPAFRTFRLFGYAAGFAAAAGVAVFNYYGSASPRTRQQMKVVLISCIIALAPILIFNIIPQVTSEPLLIPPGFSFLFFAFIPLGLGYAVFTQRLMDIEVFIRRSIIYGLVTMIMAAILSTALLVAVVFHEMIGVLGDILVALALGGIAAALFGPIKNGIERGVDRLFYRDRYDYRKIIQNLNLSLNSQITFNDISRLIVGTTVNTLNLAGGCLLIQTMTRSLEIGAAQGTLAEKSKEAQLLALMAQREPAVEFPQSADTLDPGLAFIIPLKTMEKEVGILCLAPKITRQDFSSYDIYLLQGIASVAATALHRAMLVRDVSLRDVFVSVASHELRTPLTAVLGYADLLMHRDPPEPTRKQWLEYILQNSQRVSSIVDDLLNVSRIQSGKININLEASSVPELLEGALSLIKETSEKHKFIVDLEPGLPRVMVDHDKFGQVIVNFLSNAVKYSPKGGRITLSARHDTEKKRVIVSVADEGMGISEADREQLFTTFHRIQRQETKGIRGSGLGLYIAKEWTEAMGGTIWLESQLNKGSTFFVSVRSAEAPPGAGDSH
jgi:signal transduction histidine kinase